MKKTCWLLTTGEAGCYSQLKGLAERLDVSYEVKKIHLPFPWKSIPSRYCPWPLLAARDSDGRLKAPWPDLVLSSGRRTVSTAMAIRKASKGKTKIVHIQNPKVPSNYFDAVIVPDHDKYCGQNVLKTTGAIHHIRQDLLKKAAEEFAPVFESFGSPRLGVLLGGNSRSSEFTDTHAHQLADLLIEAHKNTGGSVLITPSYRTPESVCKILQSRLADIPFYFWDKQTPNPYMGILALSDSLLVTTDSVSMMSEACYTGKPVYLFRLQGGNRRHDIYIKKMMDMGAIRWFKGSIDKWTYDTFDESARAADFLKERKIA